MVSALLKCFKRSYSLFLYDIDARWPFKMEGALSQRWILFKRAQGNTVTLPNTSCNFIHAGWPFRKPIKISFDTPLRLSFSAFFHALQAHRARPADAAHTHADYPHN